MSSGKLDVLVPWPPTAVRLPVLSQELDALGSSSMGPSSPTSVGTGEVGGCEGVGGISVGIGASVGDETSRSRKAGLRGTGGTGGTGAPRDVVRVAQVAQEALVAPCWVVCVSPSRARVFRSRPLVSLVAVRLGGSAALPPADVELLAELF